MKKILLTLLLLFGVILPGFATIKTKVEEIKWSDFTSASSVTYATNSEYKSSTTGFTYKLGAYKNRDDFQQNKSKGCYFNISANSNNYTIAKVELVGFSKTSSEINTYIKAYKNSEAMTVSVTTAGSGTGSISTGTSISGTVSNGNAAYDVNDLFFAYYISSSAASFTFSSIKVTYEVDEGGSSQLQDANLSWSTESCSAVLEEYSQSDFPTLSKGTNAAITYSSSNTDVATINPATGEITLAGKGETTITAIAAANYEYKAGSAKYTLTVTSNAPEPVTTTTTFTDFSNSNWKFPGTAATSESVHKNGDQQIIVYNTKLNNSALLMTKTTGEITLSPVSGLLKEVRIYSNSGASPSVIVAVTANGDQINTTDNTVKLANPNTTTAHIVKANRNIYLDNGSITISVTNGYNAQITKIEVITEEVAGIVAAPKIEFDELTNKVTLSAADGAAIYYTIDSNDPTDASTPYGEPFEVVESCTVKAIAVKDDKTSNVTAKEIKIVRPAMNIADMQTMAPANGDKVIVGFPMTVVYTNGSYIYVTDSEGNGTLIYKSESSYNVGDVIPAGWTATYSPYNGLPEWVGELPTASTETAEVVIPTVESVTMADVNRVVTITDVFFAEATPASKTAFTATLANGESLAFYNQFGTSATTAGIHNVKVAVSLNNGNLQVFPIEYTLALKEVDPVISPVEMLIKSEGTFTFTPADFLNGVTDFEMISIEDKDLMVDDTLFYIAGNTATTATLLASWSDGTLYKGGEKEFTISITRPALVDADPVISTTEILTDDAGTFVFTEPENFLNGVTEFTLTSSDEDAMIIVDGIGYMTGEIAKTVTLTATWETGDLYNAGSATFEVVIKERERISAEISITPTELKIDETGNFEISAPEGFFEDVKNFKLTSSNESILAVVTEGEEGAITYNYMTDLPGTVTLTATWDKGLKYQAGSQDFEISVSAKFANTVIYDQFGTDWTPAMPKSSSATEATTSKGDLSMTYANAYCISSKDLFLTRSTGYALLKETSGRLKRIIVRSGTGCANAAVAKVTAIEGDQETDLGTLALGTDKGGDFTIAIAENKHIENAVIKIEATSAANVQINSITIETEVDMRPSPEIKFSAREYTAIKGREDKFVKPVPTVDKNYDGKIIYSSSNPEVAEIDEEGNITFGEVIGKTIITAVAPETNSFAYDETFYILVYDDPTLPATVTKDYDTFNTGWSPALPATSAEITGEITTHERNGLSFDIRNARREGAALRLLAGTGAIRIHSRCQDQSEDHSCQLTGLAFYSNTGASTKSKITIEANGQDLGTVELNSANTTTPFRVNVPEDIVNAEIVIRATADAAVELSRIRVETREEQRPSAGFSFPKDEVHAFIGKEFSNALQNVPEDLTVTYTSSNEDVATIDEEGKITLVAPGETTITAASEGTIDYRPTVASYKLIVAEVEKLQFIVRHAGKTVEIEGEEGVFTATVNAKPGDSMTITTNIDDATIVITDKEGNTATSPITFTTEGDFVYEATARTEDETITLTINVNVAVEKGSDRAHAYSVAEILAMPSHLNAPDGVWVKGVIAGYCSGSGNSIKYETTTTSDTNIAFADADDSSKFMPVQLESKNGTIQADLGLKTNPDYVGDVLYINVTKTTDYFSVRGIKTDGLSSYDHVFAAPEADKESGKYIENVTATLGYAKKYSSLNSFCKIVYTTDGSEPTATSAEYTAPIEFTEGGVYTVKTAMLYRNRLASPVATYTYTVVPVVEMESISQLVANADDVKALYPAGVVFELGEIHPYARKGTTLFVTDTEKVQNGDYLENVSGLRVDNVPDELSHEFVILNLRGYYNIDENEMPYMDYASCLWSDNPTMPSGKHFGYLSEFRPEEHVYKLVTLLNVVYDHASRTLSQGPEVTNTRMRRAPGDGETVKVADNGVLTEDHDGNAYSVTGVVDHDGNDYVIMPTSVQDSMTGIQGIAAAAEGVMVIDGKIVAPADAEIFNVAGMRVAAQDAGKGIYIVRLSNGATAKVLVK